MYPLQQNHPKHLPVPYINGAQSCSCFWCFGARVKRMRKERCISRDDLAVCTGLSVEIIHLLEHGEDFHAIHLKLKSEAQVIEECEALNAFPCPLRMLKE